jgi:nitrogen regulatory protein P-II 1
LAVFATPRKWDDQMIKIEAVVRPERITAVVEALDAAGCGGYSYVNVTGRGNQQGIEVFTGRGATTTRRTALPKVLITTVISDDKKEAVIAAVIEAARSADEGNIGDGKIFISPVSEIVRVRTGERDAAAL